MFKKMTVLAMAVGVVAALALPTSASAEWKHHNTAIQNDVSLNFTGNARFQGGLGGVECQLTSTLVFEASGDKQTGKVQKFKTDPGTATENCKGLGGLGPCQVHNLTPQENNNWVFHTATVSGQSKIKVTNGDITSQLTGGLFCLVKHVKLTAPVEPNHFVTLLPNQPDTFTSGQIHGQLEADLTTKNNTVIHKETVTVSGTFQLESNAHTYSI